MAKLRRTINDISNDIREESLSTRPLLTDGYTYGNVNELRENILNKIPDEESLESMEETIHENLHMKQKKAAPKKPTKRGNR